MNDMQKKLLIAVGAFVLIMLLYPPYRVYGYSGNSISDTGYAWIFDLPYRATVDVVTLVVQWLGTSIVGGIAYFILKAK